MVGWLVVHWIGRGIEGNCQNLTWSYIPVFAWKQWGKPSKLLSGLLISWPRYEAKFWGIWRMKNTHLTAMFVIAVSLWKGYSLKKIIRKKIGRIQCLKLLRNTNCNGESTWKGWKIRDFPRRRDITCLEAEEKFEDQVKDGFVQF
jgi:hypothetical protein